MAPFVAIDETPELAVHLFGQYGLLALFFVFILEGAMLLYFAPSESLVPFAIAFLASTPTDYAIIIVIATIGATLGQYGLFLAAKRGGRGYLLEQRWFRISDERLKRFDQWFDRWGPLVIPVSNTLLFTRGMLTVPAGFARMNDRDFILLSALGTLIFQSILAGITLGLLDLLGF